METTRAMIERRFATVPGKFYRLDFDFSETPSNGGTRILFVSVNGAVRDRFEWVTADIGNSYQVDMKWQRRTVAFEATSDSTLIELSSGAGGVVRPEVDNPGSTSWNHPRSKSKTRS